MKLNEVNVSPWEQRGSAGKQGWVSRRSYQERGELSALVRWVDPDLMVEMGNLSQRL